MRASTSVQHSSHELHFDNEGQVLCQVRSVACEEASGNTSMQGQLGHREEDAELKNADSDLGG